MPRSQTRPLEDHLGDDRVVIRLEGRFHNGLDLAWSVQSRMKRVDPERSELLAVTLTLLVSVGFLRGHTGIHRARYNNDVMFGGCGVLDEAIRSHW